LNEFLLYLESENAAHIYRVTDNPAGSKQSVRLTTMRTAGNPYSQNEDYTLDFVERYNGDWGEFAADWNLQYVHGFAQQGWHLLKERP